MTTTATTTAPVDHALSLGDVANETAAQLRTLGRINFDDLLGAETGLCLIFDRLADDLEAASIAVGTEEARL